MRAKAVKDLQEMSKSKNIHILIVEDEIREAQPFLQIVLVFSTIYFLMCFGGVEVDCSTMSHP
jgi:hypothetical protein